MSADGTPGSHNQPQFLTNGAPELGVDENLVADYAAKVGNRRVGTTAERVAATGKDVWDGLVWGDTTDGLEYKYHGSQWTFFGGLVFGHLGKTEGLQSANPGPVIVKMNAAQKLAGGMTFDAASSALVVPFNGLYSITGQFRATGPTAGLASGQLRKNNNALILPFSQTWKGDNNDHIFSATVALELVAGDKISLAVTTPGGDFTYGTTGYDGTFLEVTADA